jgi:iron complex transport system ATP-binding protein
MKQPLENVALCARGLSIGYDMGKKTRCIASGLDLTLAGGEFICLLGPNGVGKSTLIRTLTGMQAPISGEIQFSGKDFHSIPPRHRARLVSVVLTETVPVGMMDTYAMVSLGRHPYSGWFGSLNQHDRDCIDSALAAVGAENLAGRQVGELSDGERQKISIARALAQETKVMLLDEPTAFLDLPRRVELMKILRDLARRKKIALLLSTHDLDLALRFADRIWVLGADGKLIQGCPEAIALSGELADVFASEKLEWDLSLGGFRAHEDPCLKATLSGSGLTAVWTQRALERLGFGLTEDPAESAFLIKIPDQSTWIVIENGKEHSFHTIEALIKWIRNASEH